MRPNPRGFLFCVLALGLAAIAYMGATARVWVVALAAGVLAVWMGDLARRDLGLTRRRSSGPRR